MSDRPRKAPKRVRDLDAAFAASREHSATAAGDRHRAAVDELLRAYKDGWERTYVTYVDPERYA